MTVPHVSEQSSRTERLLELIAPKLQLVEEELQRNFESKIKTIHEVGEHILAGGGKRLRPALLLLVSKMLRYDGYRDVIYGAVVEFIHTATLVHDDIIDEAAIRRGRTSINYRWGNNLTVLVGDYLYTHSMSLALAEGNLDILRLLSNVTIRMIEGEILALEQNGRADLSIVTNSSVILESLAYPIPVLFHLGPIIEPSSLLGQVSPERNFSTGADCRSTLSCLERLGVAIDGSGGSVTLVGRGVGRLTPSAGPLSARPGQLSHVTARGIWSSRQRMKKLHTYRFTLYVIFCVMSNIRTLFSAQPFPGYYSSSMTSLPIDCRLYTRYVLVKTLKGEAH